ncbi:MAG: polyprenyl synthetase family protein [Chloroflexota bacterium]|nr:polyprenyl synthetase family protein [Chloroflexota bacterium]
MIAQYAARYLTELDGAMRRAADTIIDAPDYGVMLRYPLGWVDERDLPYNHPTGKRIRPILLLLSTEAAGGDWRAALPAAAAVELLHNFSLIHDDIQDDSPTRHGRPAVWAIWGRNNAINAGDAMFTLAYTALHALTQTGIPATTMLEVWAIFNRTNLELTRGQHLDMRFERLSVVPTEDYLSMIAGKSAALVSACAQIGALVGGADVDTARAFAAFGLNLGLAFQIRDDILGIWGDPMQTGKSAATDILSRKKSLPVLYGLERSPELVECYAREPFAALDVAEAVALLDAIGAQAYTIEQEERYFRAALAALERTGVRGDAADGLRRLSEWLFQRAY